MPRKSYSDLTGILNRPLKSRVFVHFITIQRDHTRNTHTKPPDVPYRNLCHNNNRLPSHSNCHCHTQPKPTMSATSELRLIQKVRLCGVALLCDTCDDWAL